MEEEKEGLREGERGREGGWERGKNKGKLKEKERKRRKGNKRERKKGKVRNLRMMGRKLRIDYEGKNTSLHVFLATFHSIHCTCHYHILLHMYTCGKRLPSSKVTGIHSS